MYILVNFTWHKFVSGEDIGLGLASTMICGIRSDQILCLP